MEESCLQKLINLSVFRFKYFDITQEKNPLKVGTDSMLLGSLVKVTGHKRALDLGAGTGVLSLMIAQKNSTISIDAIEINEAGMIECSENFTRSPWKERLNVFQGDYFKFEFHNKYDLIISNPPYYIDTLLAFDDKLNRAKHSDQNEVLKFFKLAESILALEGKFWIIFPQLSFNFFIEIARQNRLFPNHIIHIHSKPSKLNKRVVVCFQRIENQQVDLKEVIVRDMNNQYTSEYKNLTKDFHWNFF